MKKKGCVSVSTLRLWGNHIQEVDAAHARNSITCL